MAFGPKNDAHVVATSGEISSGKETLMSKSSALKTESSEEMFLTHDRGTLFDEVGDELVGRKKKSKTLSRKEMTRQSRKLKAQGVEYEIIEYKRPQTRAECAHSTRPCLYVSCRHHLYLDVNPITGSIKFNFPDKEVWELEETCALDVAERGGITLEEVGEIMNLTRERIRQVEVKGLEKLKEDINISGLDSFLDWDAPTTSRSEA